MRFNGTTLAIYVLLAVFALAVVSATPASASKLSTWLLGGASAYEFSQGNTWAGVALGAGAYSTWPPDRNGRWAYVPRTYYYPQTYTYAYPQAYYYPQPQTYYYYPQTRTYYYYPRTYAYVYPSGQVYYYGRYGY